MQLFGGILEASLADRDIQRLGMVIYLCGQRRSHLARALRIAVGAGCSCVVEQQCTLFRRIPDLGKAITAGGHAPDRLEQQPGCDRLAQETVKTGVAQSFALFGPAVGGERDDPRGQFSGRLVAYALPGRHAVHVGHVEIHQYDVERVLPASGDGLETVSGQLQGRNRGRQRGLDEIEVDFMVVHRENRQVRDFLTDIIAHAPQYNAMPCRTTISLVNSAMLLLAATFCLWPAHADAALRFELETGPSAFGNFRVEGIRATQGQATTLEINGISHPRMGPLGSLTLRCPVLSSGRCSSGRMTWDIEPAHSLALDFERGPGQIALAGPDGASVRLRWFEPRRADVAIDDLSAAWIPPRMLALSGLADVSGRLSGTLDLSEAGIQAEFRVRQLDFDTPDGRIAGAGLAFGARLDWTTSDQRLQLDADWSTGELLLGPAYLPSPEAPVVLEARARNLGQAGWQFDRLALRQAQSLSLVADGRIVPGDAMRIAALDLEIERAALASLWRQGLNSIAGTMGWGQLDPGGSLDGRIRIENDAIAGAGLRLSGVAIDDAADRVSITDLGAWVSWDRAAGSLEIDADWQDARLFRIPLGASALAFRTNEAGTLALADSFRLPVLDGALVIERLEWRDWTGSDRRLAMDARLEPVDLSALTRALGWTEFGGRLSGRFPGIRLSGGVIDVQGGLNIDLFGGQARINQLSIERPFGSLPALAADIEFERLDLEQVTGAFEFGRMLGLMSGHVRDLRLLDWQPVRFDAWFETLEDSPEREISQKAVDSISSLSGGGGAAISGTLLRWFDDFPYRKAALGCRLAQNVCRMRGLEDVENGGYMILKGRLIPRLDIVGYQRRVDWPRLLAQLAAASASAE